MKIEVITKEELSELKTMMQKILDLLEARNEENYDWVDSNGMREMLNCSEGALFNYRNSGLLPYAKHGGKIYYSKKVVNDTLKRNMTMPVN